VRTVEAVRVRDEEREEQRVVSWQMTQASNGVRYAQCELGKRYLQGDGVPVNTNLARLWLEKAAAQGSEEAGQLLKALP